MEIAKNRFKSLSLVLNVRVAFESLYGKPGFHMITTIETIAVETIAAIDAIVAIIWKPLLRSLRSLRLRSLRSYGNQA